MKASLAILILVKAGMPITANQSGMEKWCRFLPASIGNFGRALPTKEYKDNEVPYNWHWFWNWGTGEACNNGTHEIDCCRWFLGVIIQLK